MKLEINDPQLKDLFLQNLTQPDDLISIISTDDQDKGKIYNIKMADITYIQDDTCDGTLSIWWKQWNGFKWLNASVHFNYYSFGNLLYYWDNQDPGDMNPTGSYGSEQ